MSRILSTFFIIAFVLVLLTLTIGSKEVQANNSIITGLSALSLTNEPTIIVHWTSSIDFPTVGYEVGYSTLPISEDNWAHVTKIEGVFGESYHISLPDNGYARIDNLSLSTTYYFAVKAYDADGNYTDISNVINKTTTDSVKSWNFSSFNEMTDNSWWDLDPALPPGSTSQVFLAYDPEKDRLMTWGGHPVSGGYPQVDDLYTYNIGDLTQENTWKIEDINFANSSDKPVGGCCTGGTYDVANKVMFKRGQHRIDSYEYYRKSNFEGWPWLYDSYKNKWFDMKAFDYMSGGNDGAGVTYDSNNQIVLILDSKHDNYYRTAVYDAYANKVTRIPINAWSALGGKRSDMGLVYDSKRNRFVVVGGVMLGVEGIRFRHTDVWTFNLTDKKWIEEEGVINSEILPTSGWTASDATYDSIHDKIILFLGFNVSGKKNFDGRYLLAFAYDPETKTWERLPDKPGHFVGGRPMDLNVIFSEKHNAVLSLESARPSYSGQGLYSDTMAHRYSTDIPLQAKPNPPENISLEATQNSAIISWNLSTNPNITNYNIYRGQAEDPWDAQYAKIGTISASSDSYPDTFVTSGTMYFYYITSVDNQGRESDSSLKARTQPPVVMEGYVSVQNNTQTKVVWTHRENDKDIAGYNIYRSECDFETYPINESLYIAGDLAQYTRPTVKIITKPAEADYVKINSDLVTASEYEDNINLVNPDVNATYPYKLYSYRIKAVNKLGVESGWSPYWTTILNPPTGLQMSKDDDNFYLSWVPPHNGEGIKGYRIYVTAGNSALEITDELTEGLINQTSVIVPKTIVLGTYKKFYVTATDNLNQEGMPSAGIWGNRPYWETTYKQFYGLSITSSFLPDGTVGQDYNTGLQAANGTPPYQWRLVSGSLPEDVCISYDGNISGMPSKVESYTFKVAVSDSSSPVQEVIKEFSLQVENPVIDIVPTPSEDGGDTPSEDGGDTPPEDGGDTPSEDGGDTPPEDGGDTPPEDGGDVEDDEVRGDLDGDGDIDRNDLNILLSHRDQPASECIACDLDGDGTITVLDARKLVVTCTRPRCSSE